VPHREFDKEAGMKTAIRLAFAAAAATLLLAAPASAGTLDQQQTDASGGVGVVVRGGASDDSLAQTFTAGRSGGLDEVDLLLAQGAGSATAPMTVEIRNASGGSPGTAVLAAASVPATAIPALPFDMPGPNDFGNVSFHFAAPAPVTAGTQYAIVAYTAESSDAYFWAVGGALDPYAGGEGLITYSSPPSNTAWQAVPSGSDLAFKTYVSSTPPSPTGLQAAALKKCKKKAKKHDWSHKKLKKCKKKARLLPV
jgi:hypothetical protein